MPTMDLWSNATNLELRQLFRSAMTTLLFLDSPSRPIYICSPWISDFVVFENRFGEFSQLVPGLEERSVINLSDCLRQLARLHEVRNGVNYFLANDDLHEKGFLTPIFYFEGSMNITYSGVHINKEKLLYHAGGDPEVAKRMSLAYLELERRWKQLAT